MKIQWYFVTLQVLASYSASDGCHAPNIDSSSGAGVSGGGAGGTATLDDAGRLDEAPLEPPADDSFQYSGKEAPSLRKELYLCTGTIDCRLGYDRRPCSPDTNPVYRLDEQDAKFVAITECEAWQGQAWHCWPATLSCAKY